jgi:hypothetical protein
VIGFTVLMVVPAYTRSSKRLTNIDEVAAHVASTANAHDFVIVAPWYLGVSFDRYYHGIAPWTTVPPISFHKYHRYDLIKIHMRAANQTVPVAGVEQSIAAALRNGGRVFVVGDLRVPDPGTSIQLLGPGLPEWRYDDQWSTLVGAFLQQHAKERSITALEHKSPVNDYENAHLIVAHGSRP